MSSILLEAHELITGPRAEDHGSFVNNCREAASIYRSLTGQMVAPTDWALVMMSMKLARHRENRENRDNLLDAAGYLGLYAHLLGMDGDV